MKNSFDKILTSTPINKQAAVVAGGKGQHWEPEVKITQAHWDAPPKCKKRPDDQIDKSGTTFGRLTVISYFGAKSDGSSQWLVRCSCGAYETRTGKAVENKNNCDDACVKCRSALAIKKRYSVVQRGKDHICSDDPLPTKPFTPTGTIAADLTGACVGSFVVIGCSIIKSGKSSKWVVRCKCGVHEIRTGSYLRKVLTGQHDKHEAMCCRCEVKLKEALAS